MKSFKGLDNNEVLLSREKNGTNILTPPKRESWLLLLLEKFKDPIIKLLLLATFISLVTGYFNGSMVESLGIIAAVFLATFISFINEYRAEREFDILNRADDTTPVKVCREGVVSSIPKSDVVKGDIIIVEQGDEIPADGILLDSMDLKVDESQLNGESRPSNKSHIPADSFTGAYSPQNLYRGTTVSEGEGVFEVTAVGDHTEIGHTAREAASITGNKTPLNMQLERLGSLIGMVGLTVAVLLFVALTVRDIWLGVLSLENPWMENVDILLRFFMISVTVIVVAVPEGLPMSVTLSLAYSMRKMTANNTLVRKMHACETMGATTIICTDKTGTLTLNKMSVAYCSAQDSLSFAEAVAHNTTAFEGVGNPTEVALIAYLTKMGFNYREIREGAIVKERLLFNSQRKFMATLLCQSASGAHSMKLYVKGAPEIIADLCLKHSGMDCAAALEEIAAFQRRGMRALAFASAVVSADEFEEVCSSESESAEVMNLLVERAKFSYDGFVAIEDPIRSNVPDAMAECSKAGIEVKIVTGDTSATAVEIARQSGLWAPSDTIEENAISGRDFAALTDEQATEVALKIKVMSRARPADKMRLVQLLRAKGNVVAVTGDGTNDAPALNYADVGLSMGSGTAVAREASDIVLLDDSFASVVSAVMWGRQIYLNIQKFILFQLTVNLVALLMALVGPFIGVEFPLTVTQMLWVNLIMDTFAALALATEPARREVMKMKPRGLNEFIIKRVMWRDILGWGLLFIAVLLPMLWYMRLFFSVFVFLQFWNLFNAKAFGTGKSAFEGIAKNRSFLFIAAVIFILQILIVQFGGEFFRSEPLRLFEWCCIIGATSLVLWAREILRFLKLID